MENDAFTLLDSGSLSVVAMVMAADPVVQAIMALLVLASLGVWSIIFIKIFVFARLRSHARRFEDNFLHGSSIEEIANRLSGLSRDPMMAVFSIAFREWRYASQQGMIAESHSERLLDRVESMMRIAASRECDSLGRSMTFLASVGSAAPFIGLLGTVWGIMNSFQAIGAMRTTSLAVVAPGIAEALLATALGLFAAIPAVLGYNKFSTELGRYGHRLDVLADEVINLLSRSLDKTSKSQARKSYAGQT